MESSTRFRSLELRFEPYVAELRHFLQGCNVAFGAPEDLVPFAQRLAVRGYFRDGIFAMIRSVIYREHEAISHGELLELVLVTVCGTQMDPEAPELQDATRRLSRVVGQAMTSLWGSSPDVSGLRPVSTEIGPEPQPSGAHLSAAEPERPVAPRSAEAAAGIGEAPEPSPRLSWLTAEAAQQMLAAARMPEAPSDVPPQSSQPSTPASAVAPARAPDLPSERSLSPLEVERLEPIPALVQRPGRRPLVPSWASAPEVRLPETRTPPSFPTITRADPEPPVSALPPRFVWVAGACALLLAPVISLLANAGRHHPARLPATSQTHSAPPAKPYVYAPPPSATAPSVDAAPLDSDQAGAGEIDPSAHPMRPRGARSTRKHIPHGFGDPSGLAPNVANPQHAPDTRGQTDLPSPDPGWPPISSTSMPSPHARSF